MLPLAWLFWPAPWPAPCPVPWPAPWLACSPDPVESQETSRLHACRSESENRTRKAVRGRTHPILHTGNPRRKKRKRIFLIYKGSTTTVHPRFTLNFPDCKIAVWKNTQDSKLLPKLIFTALKRSILNKKYFFRYN